MMFCNKKKIIFLVVVLILSCVLYANVVHAQGGLFAGIEDCRSRGDCTINNFLQLAVNIANIIMKIVGVAALVMFCVGGVHMLTAAGREAQVKRGREILIGATIGLFFIFFSWFIVRAIQDIFQLEPEYRVISWVEDCSEVKIGDETISPVPDGTPCGEEENKVCKDGSCVSECEAKGYECKLISCECDPDCTEEQFNKCVLEKGCMRGLCPGAKKNVCCKE